jgi:hypothetical protein
MTSCNDRITYLYPEDGGSSILHNLHLKIIKILYLAIQEPLLLSNVMYNTFITISC